MLATIKGYYDHGQIILQEDAPVSDKTAVIVTFLIDEPSRNVRKRMPGALKGRVSIPDDFDEPLADLKEYT
jgi:hypothetical protein